MKLLDGDKLKRHLDYLIEKDSQFAKMCDGDTEFDRQRKYCFEANILAYELCQNVMDYYVVTDVHSNTQEKKYCKMIPLEPDCRGCTNVFICTNCHLHVHLGFIRKEYSGSFCLECGAEVMDGDTNG